MLNDFATLKSAVADWLHRADLTNVIPNFIQLAEARISVDLRLSNQQKQVSGTTVSGVITLPTDFRQAEALFVPAGGTERGIDIKPPSEVATRLGLPTGAYVLNNTIVLNGSQDMAYRLVYFSGIPSLSDALPQNWLILNYPNVYLYACLLEASPYLKDDNRINVWGAGYQNAIAALAAQDDRYRFLKPRQRVQGMAP